LTRPTLALRERLRQIPRILLERLIERRLSRSGSNWTSRLIDELLCQALRHARHLRFGTLHC
jgi:hypothetical protein